jgi:hypothetical protein
VTVALTEGVPESRGRSWTAEDYARRDAALARLGMRPFVRRVHGNGEEEGQE